MTHTHRVQHVDEQVQACVTYTQLRHLAVAMPSAVTQVLQESCAFLEQSWRTAEMTLCPKCHTALDMSEINELGDRFSLLKVWLPQGKLSHSGACPGCTTSEHHTKSDCELTL